jgi:hypothetical protein
MILNKLKLVENITRDIVDNSTGLVSPRDVRQNMLDLADSVHLLTADHNLFSKNFGTVDTRTTRAGDKAIGKLDLPGYKSIDNTAFGYSALMDIYTGARNTAVGSHALGCALYGHDNIGIGNSAVAGAVFGSGNVGVGNFSLHRVKEGNLNIAIGHGAGYYINPNDSYKFYLGSHDVNSQSVCDNPLGSGLIPLLHGDLIRLKLGVAVSGLDDYGKLQVGGDITPSGSDQFNLGHSDRRWRHILASRSLNYPSGNDFTISRSTSAGNKDVLFLGSGGAIGVGNNTPSGNHGIITSSGSIVPLWNDNFQLGHPDLRWGAGFFKSLHVSGALDVTEYNYKEINSCIYECKTLYLASSGDPCYSGGPPCGYLTDQELEGGGLVLQSSGTDGSEQGFFRRNYEWVYRSPDPTLKCLETDSPYSRSSWNSNISIHVASGSHVRTDRVTGYDTLALINQNGCYGWFIQRDDDIIRTGDLGQNEIQKITINATGGTFTLTYSGQTTSAIAFDASSSDVQSALEALSNLEVGDIAVTGNNGGPWTVTFTGTLAKTNVAQITCNGSNLTLGGTVNESSRTFFAHRYLSQRVNSLQSVFLSHRTDYFYIRKNSSATQGAFKLRIKREDTGAIFTTEPIPFDATRVDVADAINDAVKAQGITGVTVLSSYAYDSHEGQIAGGRYDSISELLNKSRQTYRFDPTGKVMVVGEQTSYRYSWFFIVSGRPDRAAISGNKNPKISLHRDDVGAQNFHSEGMDGSQSFYYIKYAETHKTQTDLVHYAGNGQYDNDAEPSDVGLKVVWRQPITGGATKEVEFFTSDTVAIAQPKFDAVFGAGAVEISSNGAGTAHHTIGYWPEGSAADDFAQAGWFIKYKSAELLAEDITPYIIYADRKEYSRNVRSIPTRDGSTLDTSASYLPYLSVYLYRSEGEGPTIATGTCSTETMQEGMADISAITKVDNVVYLTKEDHITPNPISPEGKIGNVTDVNFIASGVDRDYHVSYSHLNSGVTVGQRLVTRTMAKRTDSAIPPREKVTGFSIDYIDEKDEVGYTGQRQDRLVVAAYDDTVDPLNAMTIMRSDSPGLVGISDIENAAHVILPETIFNIQSTGETIARNTTWGTTEKTSLQLLGAQNNPLDTESEGVELEYTVTNRRADMSLWDDGGSKVVISLDNNNKFVGIHKLDPNEMLTLGSGLDGSDPAISMRERSEKPSSTADYGKIYIKPKSITNQTQSAYLLDDAGNEFDLTLNKYDMNDARAVYTDDWCNTLAGKLSNKDRSTISSSEQSNTGYGCHALYDINGGDNNVAIGAYAGDEITTGSRNITIGDNSATSLKTGNDNIIIGRLAGENSPQNMSNNIFIGNDIGKNLSSPSDYKLLIGHSDKVLLKGVMGPQDSDKVLEIENGRFRVSSADDYIEVRQQNGIFASETATVLDVVDTNHDHAQGGIGFNFTGLENGVIQNTHTLLKLRSHKTKSYNCGLWPSEDERDPYAELDGDLYLGGSINFCDGTSMASTSGIVIIAGTGISEQLNTTLNNMEFHLNIEELQSGIKSPLLDQAVPSNLNSYVAVSTSGVVGKMNLQTLGNYLQENTAYIQDCHNHIFSNTTNVDKTVNCRNFYAGYKAGNLSTGWTDSNFIGTEAGAGATITYNEATNWSSTFIGYRAGYNAANVDHSVFIGSQAGLDADNARYSVFIGDSAGDRSYSNRSVGIGDNALQGVTGTNNIEITAGVGGSNRVMSDGSTHDMKIAIGNCLAGDMSNRRMSIGFPNLNPDAVLEVRANGTETRLQEWKNNAGTVVAYVDNNGNFVKVT